MERELVLRGVFTHLMERGFQLGVRDYLDGISALRGGFGGSSRADLLWLCQTLWARTDVEARTIALLFQEIPLPTEDEAALELPVTRRRSRLQRSSAESETMRRRTSGEGESAGVSFSTAVAEGLGIPRAVASRPGNEFFVLTPRPVIPVRTLTIGWRRFRAASRTGPKIEMNIAATIEAKCSRGVLDEPVFVSARRNQARLVIFVDVSPSMLAWRGLNELLTASLSDGQLGRWDLFYFDNVPGPALYYDAAMLRPTSLNRVLRDCEGSALLVVSDAGAARGTRDQMRIRETAGFFSRVSRECRDIAWINPMPRARWQETSAEQIARAAGGAMFELTADGLMETVDVLRGQGFPSRVLVR
jgi:hypothetical protein